MKDNYRKLVPAAYFMVVGILLLLGDVFSGHTPTWKHLVFTLFLSVPFIVRKVWAYLLFGLCYTILSGYLLLSMISFLLRYLHGAPFHNPALNFGVGSVFLGISLVCSFALIYLCIDRSGRNIRLKEEL